MLEQKLHSITEGEDNNAKPPYSQTHCYKQPGVQLYAEDCLDTLRRMSNGSVDLLLQDTPFGCTQNEWDIKPDLSVMWEHWQRVTKQNGAMIFFATQPFASELIVSNAKQFRYDIIWEKDRSTGFLNANKMPLRSHEHILIFYRALPIYNPQKSFGHKPMNKCGKEMTATSNYGKYEKVMTGGNTDRMPRSIIYENVINSQHKPIHPTEKPVDLMRYLIKTYSNENETVFDGYSGSGSTAAACLKEKRNFIGSEMNKEYFDLSVKRLSEIIKQPELF